MTSASGSGCSSEGGRSTWTLLKPSFTLCQVRYTNPFLQGNKSCTLRRGRKKGSGIGGAIAWSVAMLPAARRAHLGSVGAQAMKVVVRPAADGDLEGINRLRSLVYPVSQDSHDPEWHQRVWSWLESHPLAEEEFHRWVLSTEEGEIVGHLAATPTRYRINGERVVAHTPADYQVLPQYGFQALLLMRKFFRTVQNCVACDMLPAVIGVETKLGAEVAGDLHYAAKLLNVSRLPVPRLPAPIRRLLNLKEQPAPARGYENQFEASPVEV